MANQSWEDIEKIYGDHDAYDELCQNAQSSDFYFSVFDSDGTTMISIVPKAFFDKEDCIWDQSMNLDHLLPKDFGEEMECVWGTERSVEDTIKELLHLGFVANNKLDDICAKDFNCNE